MEAKIRTVIARIDEAGGITEKVIAFPIECGLRQFRLAPVPRRDERALEAHL